MATDVTIEQLRDLFRSHQGSGSNTSTILGVAGTFCLFADALANSIGAPSITGFLFSSVGLANYHAIFFFVITSQLVLFAFSFSRLRKSRWQSASAHTVPLTLARAWRFAAGQRAMKANPFKGHTQEIWIVVGILLMTFGASLWVMSVMANELFSAAAAIPVAILLAATLAWDLTVVLVVARRDIYVVVGIVLAAIFIAIGLAYGPEHFLRPYSWGYEGVPHFKYWEMVVVSLMVVGALPLITERNQESTTYLLHLAPDSLPDGATPVPLFAEDSGRPVRLMFAPKNIKAIGLYGSSGARQLQLLNLNDHQLSVPLHGHSLTIWNLTSLEAHAGRGSVVVDSTNSFRVNAELQMGTTTTASFRQKSATLLDPTVVDFATDVIFNNTHLLTLLHAVGTEVFESCVHRHGLEIQGIKSALEGMIPQIEFEASMPVPHDVMERLDSQNHAAVRQAQMNYMGTHRVEDLAKLRARYYDATSAVRSALGSADSKWLGAVTLYFRQRVQSTHSVEGSAGHQVETLLQALDIKLAFGPLALQGAATDCVTLLQRVQDELVAMNRSKEAVFVEAVRHKQDQRIEIVKAVLGQGFVNPKLQDELLRENGVLPPRPAKAAEMMVGEDEPKKLN